MQALAEILLSIGFLILAVGVSISLIGIAMAIIIFMTPPKFPPEIIESMKKITRQIEDLNSRIFLQAEEPGYEGYNSSEHVEEEIVAN